MLAHKLQRIPVPGGDKTVPALRCRGGGQGAEDVIRLIPLLFHHRQSHQAEQLLAKRQLLGQLLRHMPAPRLVFRVLPVAEGGRGQVECRRHMIRLHLLTQLLINIQKSVQRVGVQPVLGGQGLHPIKRTVDDAVAVEH